MTVTFESLFTKTYKARNDLGTWFGTKPNKEKVQKTTHLMREVVELGQKLSRQTKEFTYKEFQLHESLQYLAPKLNPDCPKQPYNEQEKELNKHIEGLKDISKQIDSIQKKEEEPLLFKKQLAEQMHLLNEIEFATRDGIYSNTYLNGTNLFGCDKLRSLKGTYQQLRAEITTLEKKIIEKSEEKPLPPEPLLSRLIRTAKKWLF